jgi:hypothetical protein
MTRRTAAAALLCLHGGLTAWIVPLSAQQRDLAGCRPAPQADAAAALRDALAALGATGDAPFVLHLRLSEATVEDYQSDRSYPPFFLAVASRESWYQPATGVLRSRGRMTWPGGEFPLDQTLNGPAATFLAGDSIAPAPAAHGPAVTIRDLDPWPLLYDWSAADRVTVVGRCRVRDYLRLVLQRAGPYGPERLALDPASHLPISLEREEPHYLWGQVAVAYVWSNWERSGSVTVPLTSFRLVDGRAEISRTVSELGAVPVDSAPPMTVPATTAAMAPLPPAFLTPTPPDSARVSESVRLLANRGYREGVALLGDTLYLLDATQGEARARADSAVIARMFPGRHPVVLVVTDLAWPHIAGLRYWVARGATVVSHPASRPFLERVLARRWTRTPDLYERRRATARFRFVPVGDSLALAGGRLRLYPIDGLGGEGGVMAWLADDRLLWAGDYIQTVQQPSTYASDVWRAAQRAGLRPTRAAAQHLPPTPWSTIDSLARSGLGHEAT